GATGHIGNVLARELVARGQQVRALVLPGDDLTPLEGVDVEIVEGDILDLDSLKKAFTGADTVYHLAAIISINPGARKLLRRINVEGTENVIKACLEAGVKRLVYTSSIHALTPPPRGEVITEKIRFEPDKLHSYYERTKAEASLKVLEAAKENGLDAVVVCPTGVIGPYDFKISNMGQFFIDYKSGALKAYMRGEYDFVHVDDAVAGLILAAEKGKDGEVYILSGEKVTVKQIMGVLEELTGRKQPKFRFPAWLAIAVSPFAYVWYKMLRTKPLFTSYSVRTLTTNCDVSHAKATRELGYSPKPVKQAIIDAVKWFEQAGYMKKS
ncbi:SDR family oxidoreductase, partial [Patescibacteria group bacterium]